MQISSSHHITERVHCTEYLNYSKQNKPQANKTLVNKCEPHASSMHTAVNRWSSICTKTSENKREAQVCIEFYTQANMGSNGKKQVNNSS